MIRYVLPVLLALSWPAIADTDAPAGIGGPDLPGGGRVALELPTSRHMRNTGGIGPRGPGSGAGLCVFTSIELAGRWQGIPALDGLQRWMTLKPGGGWPRKVDEYLKRYCAEKGVPVPPYIQIENSADLEILRLIVKTGRYACIRIVSGPGYGSTDHMVNLAHAGKTASDEWVWQDNNFPGQWSHIPNEAAFRRHYGKWAIAFLGPPPPPAPVE